MITNTFRISLVVSFWVLLATLYVRWRLRQRREAKEGEIERKALVEQLLRPNWQQYEQHLQRPAPTALRDLFADERLVTTFGLQVTRDVGISTFNPLNEDGLIDTAHLLGFDILPFATSDCGDAIILRPGKDQSDVVYIVYHDDPGKGLVVIADSVATMLKRLREDIDAA